MPEGIHHLKQETENRRDGETAITDSISDAVVKRRTLTIVLLCGELVLYSCAWCVAQLVLLFPERLPNTTQPKTSDQPLKSSD